MDNDRIFTITQSLLSFLVVIGAGFMMLQNNELSGELTGLAGVVIGYYFNQASTNRQFAQYQQIKNGVSHGK